MLYVLLEQAGIFVLRSPGFVRHLVVNLGVAVLDHRQTKVSLKLHLGRKLREDRPEARHEIERQHRSKFLQKLLPGQVFSAHLLLDKFVPVIETLGKFPPPRNLLQTGLVRLGHFFGVQQLPEILLHFFKVLLDEADEGDADRVDAFAVLVYCVQDLEIVLGKLSLVVAYAREYLV